MTTIVDAAVAPGLSSIPVGVLVPLGAVLVLEVVLAVIALVDLYRRPIARVALGNKWVWVAIIVLVNVVGPILYLVLGRKSGVVAEEQRRDSTPGHAPVDVGDALYGPRDDSTKS